MMLKSAQEPLLLSDTNLSRLWSRLLVHVIDHPGKVISPLVLSLSGFDTNGFPEEDDVVRSELDRALAELDFWDVETVAFTIFPYDYWKIAEFDRAKLFTIYQDAFPRLKAWNPINNRRGLYFERLTMYGSGPCNGNQLEWILSQYNTHPTVRRSMLQAATFDPSRDHLPDAQLGFPCLQQVSFVPTASGLVVNAFYATQQLFDKAYGNYLGLSLLGAFMAHEMGLNLARLNITVGVEKLERVPKGSPTLTKVIAAARACTGQAAQITAPA
jgi:hypothetical protein